MRDVIARGPRVVARAAGRGQSKSLTRRVLSHAVEAAAALAVLAVFTVSGAAFACAGMLDNGGKLAAGVRVAGSDVGGLTPEAAQQALIKQGKLKLPQLSVTVDGKQYSVAPEDISEKWDVAQTLAAAMKPGHDGTALQRLADILSLRTAIKEYPLTLSYDKTALRDIAERISSQNTLPPRSAALAFNPDGAQVFSITAGSDGKAVNADSLYSMMQSALDKGVAAPLSVKSNPVKPAVTAASLESRTQLLATFTTMLTDDTVRNSNIKIASDTVTGTVINPGDTFSFNTRTGARTKEKGYDLAPTISGGQLVDELGGGVCQVSTTVYNAALLAGFEVVERHRHTWPMYYVSAGLDAMVDFDSAKDLKLKNTSSQPVYIVMRMDASTRKLSADLYGLKSPDAVSVSLEGYQVVSPGRPVEIDIASQPETYRRVLSPERNGYKVSVYRVYTTPGNTRREFLYDDYYPSQQGKIELGTKPPEDGVK